MRKNHYRIAKIHKGEDTPCKSECDYYWDNRKCAGNCQLIRRWKFIPVSFYNPKRDITLYYDEIDGYVYKRIKK